MDAEQIAVRSMDAEQIVVRAMFMPELLKNIDGLWLGKYLIVRPETIEKEIARREAVTVRPRYTLFGY